MSPMRASIQNNSRAKLQTEKAGVPWPTKPKIPSSLKDAKMSTTPEKGESWPLHLLR